MGRLDCVLGLRSLENAPAFDCWRNKQGELRVTLSGLWALLRQPGSWCNDSECIEQCTFLKMVLSLAQQVNHQRVFSNEQARKALGECMQCND